MTDPPLPADTGRLINELLTKAGMIMEDAAVTAVIQSSEGGDVRKRIEDLERSASSIGSLVKAAKALYNG